MKKAIYYFSLVIGLFFVLSACKKSEEIDKEKPVINLSINDAFPVDCDTLYFGESFTFKAKFSDNAELGGTNAFSIDIHNNFDHHSHSTSTSSCSMDADKTPVNPYLYIESFSIPEGKKEYTAEVTIVVPKGNSDGDYESGDYHFFISLTDKEGWSAQKGMSVKMLQR